MYQAQSLEPPPVTPVSSTLKLVWQPALITHHLPAPAPPMDSATLSASVSAIKALLAFIVSTLKLSLQVSVLTIPPQLLLSLRLIAPSRTMSYSLNLLCTPATQIS